MAAVKTDSTKAMHQHGPNRSSPNFRTFKTRKTFYLSSINSIVPHQDWGGCLHYNVHSCLYSRGLSQCVTLYVTLSPLLVLHSHISQSLLVIQYYFNGDYSYKALFNSFHQLQMLPGKLSALKQLWLIGHLIWNYPTINARKNKDVFQFDLLLVLLMHLTNSLLCFLNICIIILHYFRCNHTAFGK